MTIRSGLMPALAVPLAVFAVAGCGSGGSSNSVASTTPSGPAKSPAPASSAGAGGGAQQVTFTETEYKLSDPGAIKTGKVTVNVKNAGKIDHALQVDGPGVDNQGISSSSPIKPGAGGKFTLNLTKPGKYKFYCPIDGHKSMGMVRYINVQ